MTDRIFKILNSDNDLSFEDYVILKTSQIGCLITFVGSLSNILLGLPLSLTLVTIGGFFIYLLIYVLVYLSLYRKFLFRIIPIFNLVYLNVLWMFNFRSNGPILYLLVVSYLFLQLLPRNANLKIVILVAFLNFAVLFSIDLLFPLSVNLYNTQLDKLVDHYMVAIFSVFLLVSFTSIFKKYYIRELAHALESDKLKSAFLANLSHEIRTPLNSIIGFSSLLAEEDYSDAEKREFQNLISSNGTQLCYLMDRLIIISKIESNNLKLVNERCDLNSLIEDLHTEFLPEFEKKQINLACLVRGRQTINTDSHMLKIVLAELLSNSLKFSKVGRTRFGAVICAEKCVFFVKDYGIGIRAENKNKIFDRFVKISENPSELVGGTGLGLSIVKSVVQLMGSEIKFSSTYEKGSVFYFTLPA